MNLAKTALYLEYIAYMLRYHYAPSTIGDRIVAKNRSQTDPVTPEPAIDDQNGKLVDSESTAPVAPKKPKPLMDDMLRATSRVDRLIQTIPENIRKWVIQYLVEKYLTPPSA